MRMATRVSVLLIAMAVLVVGAASFAHAAGVTYGAVLTGPNESPPNASPGTGVGQVDYDPATHLMHVYVNFSGLVLTGTGTTASHIHAATAVAGTGTAGVATTTPTFAGFPLNVRSGDYSIVLDMTQASSYNPAYVTAHGGNTTQAEADLVAAIAAGKAYLNVHSNSFPGGEIRGFLTDITVPVSASSWGRIKKLYR